MQPPKGAECVRGEYSWGLAHLLGEHVAIDVLVAVFKEDRFAPDAPCGHMMRATWTDDARNRATGLSWHETP